MSEGDAPKLITIDVDEALGEVCKQERWEFCPLEPVLRNSAYVQSGLQGDGINLET